MKTTNEIDKVRGYCLGGCGKIVVYKYPDRDTVLDKLCDECFMKAGVTFPPKKEQSENLH